MTNILYKHSCFVTVKLSAFNWLSKNNTALKLDYLSQAYVTVLLSIVSSPKADLVEKLK